MLRVLVWLFISCHSSVSLPLTTSLRSCPRGQDANADRTKCECSPEFPLDPAGSGQCCTRLALSLACVCFCKSFLDCLLCLCTAGKYVWGGGVTNCEHPYGECTKVFGAGGSSPADANLCANSPKPPGPPPACPGIAYLAQNTTRFSVSCTLTY